MRFLNQNVYQAAASVLAVVLPVTALCGVTPQSQENLPAQYLLRPATRPITINGILTEWDSCDSVRFGPGPDREQARTFAVVRAQWDWNKLYVAYQVRDTSLSAMNLESSTSVYEDDCIELYLSVRPRFAPVGYLGPDEYHFVVNIRGSRQTNRGVDMRIDEPDNKDTTWTTDFLSAVVVQGTINDSTDLDSGYTVEMAIPWEALGYVPRPGDTLSGDFCVEEWSIDTNRYYDWAGLDAQHRFSQPELWGRIVLVGTPPGQARPAAALDKSRRTGTNVLVAGAIGLLVFAAILWTRRRKPSAIASDETLHALDSPGELSPAQMVLDKTQAIITEQYAQDITTSKAARQLFMSERNLQRLLREASGKTFTDLLTAARLQRAKAMIKTTDRSISEIALDVGFQTYANFRRLYRAAYGTSPSDYRKTLRSESETT